MLKTRFTLILSLLVMIGLGACGGRQANAPVHTDDPAVTTDALAKAIVDGDADKVSLLLQRGADPNASGPNGSLLNTAIGARSRSFEIVKLLLDKGANPNLQSESGLSGSDTPFCRAALHGSYEIVGLMLQKGAHINQSCIQDAPAFYFIKDQKMLKILLDGGAKVESSRMWMVCGQPPVIFKMLASKLPPGERSFTTRAFVCKH